MGKLDNRVAIITGAARGMGKQIALTFAREGADIALADVSDLEPTLQEVKSLGRRAVAIKTDVSRREEVQHLVDATMEKFKKIDILVNNAGITRHMSLLDMTEEAWDAVLNVNLKGVFLCTQAAARSMVKQKSGMIINIASVSGTVSNLPGQANYAPSKAGVIKLTKISALELGPYGIRVNAIAPGTILTDMLYIGRTPEEVQQRIEERKKEAALGRVGIPQDIANVALFLATNDSSFITGQVIGADGGRL